MVLAYAVGSLPFGYWCGRLARGIDIRNHGSRNLGATNVYRVLGPAYGATVLILDVVKGAVVVLACRLVTGSEIGALVGGLLSILGHAFSPWVGFRGGKGVATGMGVWLMLAPLPTLLALLVWGCVLAVTRRVSPASLTAAIVLPIGVAFIGPAADRLPRVLLAVALTIFVWIRHRANVTRLRKGDEPPLWGVRGS